MVKDPLKPNQRADNFYAIGYLKHLGTDHIIAIYQSALDSKKCMVYMH